MHRRWYLRWHRHWGSHHPLQLLPGLRNLCFNHSSGNAKGAEGFDCRLFLRNSPAQSWYIFRALRRLWFSWQHLHWCLGRWLWFWRRHLHWYWYSCWHLRCWRMRLHERWHWCLNVRMRRRWSANGCHQRSQGRLLLFALLPCGFLRTLKLSPPLLQPLPVLHLCLSDGRHPANVASQGRIRIRGLVESLQVAESLCFRASTQCSSSRC